MKRFLAALLAVLMLVMPLCTGSLAEQEKAEDHLVLSLGPDKQHKRHSEGDFLRLNDGRILFVYSRFGKGNGDDSPSDLAAIWSDDEGETWTEPVTILEAAEFGTHNIMSVSLLRMQNGDVGLFYLAKIAPDDNRIYLSRSNDEGETWYRHVECTLSDRPAYYVMNNDRVERLSTGRIILPLAYHRGAYSERTNSGYWDGRASAMFLYSDDDGETWQESADTVFPPFTGTSTGLQEPGVAELANGVLWGYARTDQLCQYEFFSFDGGVHWTAAQPSQFSSPTSPMKIARNPETGLLYAVWNPVPNYNGRKSHSNSWGRTPLVWACSRDEGESWLGINVIEDNEKCGYCYPAVFFTDDGAMLVAYCAGLPKDHNCLSRLNIMKIIL